MRTTLIAVALLLLASPTYAEEGAPAPAKPSEAEQAAARPVPLLGTPLQVTPPAGTDWKIHVDATVPGQWAISYARGDIVMQAMVVPIKPITILNTRKLLFAALQGLKRNVGMDGAIGMPWSEETSVLGRRGANGTFSARRNGRMQGGRARVLFTETHWGFAWGFHPTGVGAAERDLVRGFVESMVPDAPTFFSPTFHNPDHLDKVLHTSANEPPIMLKHVLAMQRLVEMASGGPMTLSRRAQLSEVLRAEVSNRDRAYRDALRDMPLVFAKHADLTEAQQRKKQTQLGTALHHGYLSRYIDNDPAATAFLHVWNESSMVLASRPRPLHRRQVDNLMEMYGFFASLAADQPRAVSTDQRATFTDACVRAWPSLEPTVRAAWLGAGSTWTRVRHTWDHADDAHRLAFRKAVLRAFVSADKRAAVSALDGADALKAWIDTNGPLDTMAVVAAGAALTTEARDAILDVLGPRPQQVPLGW